MINDMPSVFEIVTGAPKQAKDQATAQKSSNIKSSGRMVSPFYKIQICSQLLLLCTPIMHFHLFFILKNQQAESQHRGAKTPASKDEDESGQEEEEQGATLCGSCGDNYANDEFWICCDVCEKWFHGKCVKITPAKAEHIKQYKCPNCSNKRPKN